MNTKAALALALLALVPTLTACSATVHMPRLQHPGPVGYQRNNATQFDPYPQSDMGPEIAGGRPPDFDKPPAEVIRARQQQPVGPWRASSPLY